jgi:formylglycine-generating enzyme required for sulfatase activity
MFRVARSLLCAVPLAVTGCTEDLLIPPGAPPGNATHEQMESATTLRAPESLIAHETVFGPVRATRVTVDGQRAGKPTVWTYVIERGDLDRFSSPFLLIVTNGDPDGTGRVSAAVVVIDGKEILGPEAFSRNVERLEREVEIRQGSEMTLRVMGAPAGVLLVEIQGDRIAPDDFVYVAPGTFDMGSPLTEPNRGSAEIQHTVTLTRGFYMSKYEVTEQWWAEVMGGAPTTSQLPRVNVTWDMAVQFCNTLSLQEGVTPAYVILGTDGNVTWNREASGYRLPTEAEWEYACRAGTTTAFNNGTNCLSSNTEANYNGNFPLRGCPTGISRPARTSVGSFPANAWGLYDLHGNVFEWVWDGYRVDHQNLPAKDPVHEVGPASSRVFRGGSRGAFAWQCRSAFRQSYRPTDYSYGVGFRPVRSAS